MKAQHNYTTAMVTAIRLRRGTAILLLLAALIVSLMLLLSTNGQSSIPTSTRDSFARHVSDALLSCRTCNDERIAARSIQLAIAAPAQRLQVAGIVSRFRANALLESCRECRDEWVAAQTPVIPTGGVSFDQPKEDVRTFGPH